MNSLVGKVISHLLSKYIKNLGKQQTNFNILKGKLSLKNVELNPNIFEDFGPKFKLEYSNIEELSINVP